MSLANDLIPSARKKKTHPESPIVQQDAEGGTRLTLPGPIATFAAQLDPGSQQIHPPPSPPRLRLSGLWCGGAGVPRPFLAAQPQSRRLCIQEAFPSRHSAPWSMCRTGGPSFSRRKPAQVRTRRRGMDPDPAHKPRTGEHSKVRDPILRALPPLACAMQAVCSVIRSFVTDTDLSLSHLPVPMWLSGSHKRTTHWEP